MNDFVARAVAALRVRRSHRVPVLMQSVGGECGVACVAMLAQYHGVPADVAALSAQAGIGRLGARVGELQQLAQSLGLPTRTIKLHTLDDLRWIDRPVILHWQFCHYVVLERFDGRTADIVDPANGRMRIDREALSRGYTGVLLWMDPPEAASPSNPRTNPALADGAATAAPSLWSFLRRYADHFPAWRRLLAVSVCIQLLALAPALLSSSLFGTTLPARDGGMLALLALAGVFVGVLDPVLEAVRNHVLIDLRTRIAARMVGDLVDHLLGAQWQALSRRSYGELLTRFHANDEIRALLSTTGIGMLLDLILALFGIVLLLIVSPAVAAIAAVIAAASGVGIALIGQRRQQALAAVFAKQSLSQGLLVQTMMGLETIRAGGLETEVGKRYAGAFGDELVETVRLSRLETQSSVLDKLTNFTGGIALLGAVSLMYLGHGLSLPAAMLAFNAGIALLGSVGKLGFAVQHLQSVRFQARRMQELLDLPQLPRVPACALGARETDGAARADDGAGALRADDLHFRHAGNAPFAIEQVGLDIPAGRFVAIVGPSGSGKSTLLTLLAGMHAPAQGELRLDDIRFDDIDPARLRRHIVLVPQFPYFFADTLRANFRLARPDADLTAIREACRMAGIAEEIEAMPMGYDTQLGEGGAGMSGGQRQRLALARAMLSRPRVLLMDESTSSLDARSEQMVMERLRALSSTRVIAAHRLSTVRSADHIIVLEQGRIVEQGSFAQLSQQAGAFRRLFGRQLISTESETSPCAS